MINNFIRIKQWVFACVLSIIPCVVHSVSLDHHAIQINQQESVQLINRSRCSFNANKRNKNKHLKKADFVGDWIFVGSGIGSSSGDQVALNFVLQAEFNKHGVGEINFFEVDLSTGADVPVFRTPSISKIIITIIDRVNSVFRVTLVHPDESTQFANFVAKRAPLDGRVVSAYAVGNSESGFSDGTVGMEMIRQ